jgi:hypothetical protein
VNTHVATQFTSSFSVTNSGRDLSVEANKAVFVKASEEQSIDAMYKPNLLGGSVKYTANVSAIGCGCVSGLYLVKTSADCDQDPTSTKPTCPSFDLMEANRHGFNLNAHPCANGTCDAASQCDLKTKEDGIKNYGANAYGYGGSRIDTRYDFTVHTEFVSDTARTKLWKLRTTLGQSGQTLTMEAECADYLQSMSSSLNGQMGFILSNWSDKGGLSDMAPEGYCSTSETCTSDSAFKSFSV